MALWKREASTTESTCDLKSEFSSLHDEKTTSGSSYSLSSNPDDINNISDNVDNGSHVSDIKTKFVNNIVESITNEKLRYQDKWLSKGNAMESTEKVSEPQLSDSELESYSSECDFHIPTQCEDHSLCYMNVTESYSDLQNIIYIQHRQYKDIGEVSDLGQLFS